MRTLLRLGSVEPLSPIINPCAYPSGNVPMYYRKVRCRYPGLMVDFVELTLRYLGWNYTVRGHLMASF